MVRQHSFGLASLLPSQAEKSLFEHEDKALYRAKKNGQNRVELDNSVKANGRAASIAIGKLTTYPLTDLLEFPRIRLIELSH